MPPEIRQPNFIDINILPEQYRPRRVPASTIVLWLVAVGLALLLIALRSLSANIGEDIARLKADLQAAQEALDKVGTPAPDVQELMGTLAQVQRSASELQQAHPTIVAGRTDWVAVMAAINNYDPARLTLTSITQANSQITLKGRATDNPVVVAYVDALKASGLFSRVDLQSVSKAPTPFATPAITPTVTPTPTPDPRDEYEIDDFRAKDIFLGQPQLHNFFPAYDVDRGKFLAKAGRYYRVFTSDLAPGVDTYLDVNVGRTHHTNDDCEPGVLSSCVEFQVGTGYDVDASVRISNRGQHGPEMWYQITIEEVVPTPTPEPPTATPLPPTPTHTPTPTPTPDLRDMYEPDYANPKPIGVAETHTHNFYPDGDVDKVTFGVKSGRLYALNTSSLSPGVDTKIVVELNGEVCPDCQNDDASDQFLESEVRFVPTTDGVAVATISNVKNSQYGPDKTYDLTLSLFSSLVDDYEPDDPFAKPIAVGETQEHSFYPNGDRDLVKFIVKEGRYYAVFTSNLALGVDTYIKVVLEDQIMGENDDYAPGTGNFASAVCFQAPIDGTAVVMITNLQQQYGVDKTYEISVNEAPILYVRPFRLNFRAVEGGANPPAQEVYINNIGGGILTWMAFEDIPWLKIDPSSGTATSVMSVSVDITGLGAGTYIEYIDITGTSLCTRNTPRTVTVTLQVIAPTHAPTSSSSSLKPPGLASLMPNPSPLQSVAADGSACPLPPAGRRQPLSGENGGRPQWAAATGYCDLPNLAFPAPEAVEFVIILELK